MIYCLTSESLGGSILFEYYPDIGVLISATIEFDMPANVSNWLASHFPTNMWMIEPMRKSIRGRIDQMDDLPTFAMFWKRWEDTRGKESALKEWKKTRQCDKVLAYTMIPCYKLSIAGYQGQLMAELYLKKLRYMDFVRDAEYQTRKNSTK